MTRPKPSRGARKPSSQCRQAKRSPVAEQILADMVKRFGPMPESFMFGDGIDWSSPLDEVRLYVELPFWLMTPPGSVNVEWSSCSFVVDILPTWSEVFVGEITDSRRTSVYQGPWPPDGDHLPTAIAEEMKAGGIRWLQRPCKTVLGITARAHAAAFRELGESDPPRARAEVEAYWASLCEAHVPVINQLIQRYRLITYDYFAFEVSAWDVPVWYLKHGEAGFRAVLLPCSEWDYKPEMYEGREAPNGPPKFKPFEWTNPGELGAASSQVAIPGEFDLLDARSLMERGDYTGAVRRTVTAIEAAVGWALLAELEKSYPPAEAALRLAKTENDFPGRLRQWRKLANPPVSQQEFDLFEATRQVRHDIVHSSRRLTHEDRGYAQKAVDTGRWLYNKVEGNADRARLRDYGALKSVGRVALALRFPAHVGSDGVTVTPIARPAPPANPPSSRS